jgi:hypothetical protein
MTKTLVVMLATVAACATLHNHLIGASTDETKTAIAQKDYPKLQQMCTGEMRVATANLQDDTCTAALAIALDKKDIAYMKPLCGRRKEMFGMRYDRACTNTLAVAAEANDLPTLHSLCDHDKFDPACRDIGQRDTFGDLDHPDCAKLPAQFEAARKTFLASDKASARELARPVIALARCGHADIIFEQVAHIGSERGQEAFGAQILLAADHIDGAALFAGYQAYVKSHAGKALFGETFQSFAGNHVGEWLSQAKHLDQCETLVAATAGSTELAQYGMLDYFVATKCAAAAGELAGLLADDAPSVREDACLALGQLGSSAELPKIRIIANSDHTNRVVERPEGSGVFVKDYFVADACSKAAGQIELRGASGHARG